MAPSISHRPRPRPRRLAVALLLAGWAASVLACGDEALPQLAFERAAGGATFEEPVEVGAFPDGRLFVAERRGPVWLVDEDEGAGERTLLLDLSERVDAEMGEGLLSVALDPAFAENGWVWAFYFGAGEPMRAELARFATREGVPAEEQAVVVLTVPEPGYNQSGGSVRFDAEGLLYLSLGDGSASTDPFKNGQNRQTLQATVLRLDTRSSTAAEPYRVPPDNPFLEDPGTLPEIYAFGFRNPFRMSIDHETGEIWLGDVGVSSGEEVNRVEAGGNYGWSAFEGTHCRQSDGCEGLDAVPPVFAYAHDAGRCAAIGGVTYRGEAIGALAGRVLFGDLCTGEVWALAEDEGEPPGLIADLDGMLVTFGLDADGEVLVADHAGGGIYRLVPAE